MLLSNDSPLFKALEEQIKNIGTIKEPEVIKEPNQPNAVELKETYLWLTKWDSNIGHLKGYKVVTSDFMAFIRDCAGDAASALLNSAADDNKDKVVYIENFSAKMRNICSSYLNNYKNILSEAIVYESNLGTKTIKDAELVDIQEMGISFKSRKINTGCWVLYYSFNEEGSSELLYRVDKTELIRHLKRELTIWPRYTYTDKIQSFITLLLGVKDPFINTFHPKFDSSLMDVIGEFAVNNNEEVTLIDPNSVPPNAVSDTKDINFSRNLKFLAIPAPIPESYDPDYDYDTKHKILKVGTKHEDRESY